MTGKRTSQKPPSYRLHKQSGQAVVSIPRGDGTDRDFLLGTYGTPESHAEYRRVLGEWEAAGRTLPMDESRRSDLTINEVAARFWDHVQQHYRNPDGSPTSEVENYRNALRPLKALYGYSIAAEFGPLALKAVRQRMIEGEKEARLQDPKDKSKRKPQKPLCRNEVNRRTSLLKRFLKWAASEELVPASVFHALQTVAGIKKGRTEAHETEPVGPVSDSTVPHLTRHVAGMVRVQRLTGMRPGEACRLRRADLDMAGPVWFYRPAQHKTAWKGKERVIGIGPKAQELLKTFFTPNLDDFLFSPRRGMEERYGELRAKRKTRVQPSQVNRRKAKPKRKTRERYTTDTYRMAIARACLKAKVPVWHPNQLRHSFGTEIRKRFGLEAAQVGLGHQHADVTQVYAESNQEHIAKIAAAIG